MKIDIQSVEQGLSPIEYFYQGCKSEATKKHYSKTLKKVLFEFFEDVLQEKEFDSRANELIYRAKKEPDWIKNVIIAMVKELRTKTELDPINPEFLKTRSLDNYVCSLKKLLDMNDIPIVWKKIYSLYPERHGDEDTRGYTRTEIKNFLRNAKAIDKSIILIASSSGIRLGAFDFQWKHIRPVYEYDGKLLWEDEQITESVAKSGRIACGMILIYAGSEHNQFAFITPETYQAIQDYKIKWTQEIGKEPKPDEPFLKHESSLVIKPLEITGLWCRVRKVVKDSGYRTPLAKGKRRHNVPLMNGFRRYFNKTNKEALSKDSVLAELIKKEMMMGHTGLIQLDKNYFKTHVGELLEEYLNSVSLLTISDEERQKMQIAKQKRKISILEKKEERITALEDKLDRNDAKWVKYFEDMAKKFEDPKYIEKLQKEVKI